ncbi:alpha/beta hydrolase [Streptomyces sp. NPDC057424]|uniref:alpha/beta hydrolase n=1 Tax=Streptomyces sp. NPDC057424 TaxID=3346127 RepID=UPI00367749DD
MAPPAREPAADTRRITLDADGIALSALVSEPAGAPPRAVVVALHGGGMNADYFAGPAHPGLSLLSLGARLGFTVLAVDRPGYRASAARLPDGLGTAEQAGLLVAALDDFAARYPTGAGFFLLAHSYGGKVALVVASGRPSRRLIGLDISGCGYTYAIDPGQLSKALERGWSPKSWGPLRLYPPGTFGVGRGIVEPMPHAERAELARWPALLRTVAPGVEAPLRLTFAEHEAFWRHDEAALADLTGRFSTVARIAVDRQPEAGHNISLGWAARSYHLRALAFLESCLVPDETVLAAGRGSRP